MGYTKVISYSNLIEVYEYEKDIRDNGRKSVSSRDWRVNEDTGCCEDMAVIRKDREKRSQSQKVRTKENARRSMLAFKRLVASNLSEFDRPVFITLTYAENIEDLKLARKDFNSFATSLVYHFGKAVKYVCVPEFQKRGAVHFHTLFWGLPSVVVGEERHTRFLAGIWNRGFLDVCATDGNIKIAGYVAKYMEKSFLDERLKGMRAWTCSRNMLKPVVDKNAHLEMYYYGFRGIDLSTATTLHDKSFETQWLGKGRYRLFTI